MLVAPHFNDPEHWHQRAEEVRVLAEQMNTERTRRMKLKIADDYDELAVSGYMPYRRGEEELMLRQCRLLALANPLMRLRGWPPSRAFGK